MKWTQEKLQEEANKYETRWNFHKKQSNAYNAASKKKLLDKLFIKHKNKGFCRKKWTEEELQKKADKYLIRSEFWDNESSAAGTASNRGIIDELFKNHINSGYTHKQVVEGYWTIDTLQEEANKYETRGDFREYNYKAYKRAAHKKLLDKLFKNHKNNGYKIINNDKYFIYVYELKKFNKAYIGLTNNIHRRDRQHIWCETEKMKIFCKENNISLPKYKILNDKLNSSDAQKKRKRMD